MRDEIFGPVLPVITYESLDRAIDFVKTLVRVHWRSTISTPIANESITWFEARRRAA